MSFRNPVVGGTTLIRDSIHSPNYSAGVSGWSINRDGSAEFANLAVRGSFSTGVPPANRVSIDSIGQPSVKFYTNGLSDPAEIYSYTRSATGESNAVGLNYLAGPNTLDASKAFTFKLDNGGTIMAYNPPISPAAGPYEGAFLWLDQDNSGSNFHRAEFGIVDTSSAIDTRLSIFPGDIATVGSDILIKELNYPTRVVDGKITPSTTTTSGVTTTVTNIGGANAQAVAVVANKAYRAMVQISYFSSVDGDRASFQLWNGTVGVTPLGQTSTRKCKGTSGFENTVMVFVWRAPITETIANLNLSIVRISGTGSLTTQTDAQYSMVVEEIGNASMIAGL